MNEAELFALIESHGGDGTDAEVAETLNGQTSQVVNRERVSTVTLLDRLEPGELVATMNALESLASSNGYFAAVQRAIESSGIRFDDERTRAAINSYLRPAVGDDLADKLLQIGVASVPIVGDVPVTADDVARARLYGAITAGVAAAWAAHANGDDAAAIVAAFGEAVA